ncbi:hypothetical protein CK203_028805 [Vitis vinifera]|uniref:Uncharacterized protein n=1 Tax=Vitis vinifera TaxID=29760 RepID=A0A438IA88_VITVI|nr:hypothetical protein CK203_028805 [Vitis vinifera]
MKAYNMKLNLAKCVFGVSAGKFMGFMVTQKGIKFNLDQIKVVMETFSLSSKKERQRLTNRLVVFGCFIARFIDKLRHFFLALKGASMIEWTSDCEQAFKEIKGYLMQPPILSNPQPGEELYMYLAISDCVVSVVLFLNEKDKEHRPIYYASKKLCPYFEAHQGWWILHVDGASRVSGSGVGLLLQSLIGEQLEQAIRLRFPASNNEAEYEVILSRLGLALALSASKLKICSDSQLVVGQIQGEYEAKDEHMAQHLSKTEDLLEESKRAHKIQVQAARFTLIRDSLYKRSFGGDLNPRDPKRQSSENTPRSDIPPDKTPRWKCLSCKQLTRVSLTLGDSKGQFQPIHLYLNTSARAEKGIVRALSHVSTLEYFHAFDHVASS